MRLELTEASLGMSESSTALKAIYLLTALRVRMSWPGLRFGPDGLLYVASFLRRFVDLTRPLQCMKRGLSAVQARGAI